MNIRGVGGGTDHQVQLGALTTPGPFGVARSQLATGKIQGLSSADEEGLHRVALALEQPYFDLEQAEEGLAGS